MSDEADRADIVIQHNIDVAEKAAHLAVANLEIEGDGHCVVCNMAVEPIIFNGAPITGRFCCNECRDSYED